MEEKFDVNEWEKKCIIYDKNRKGLNFEVAFRLEDGNAVVKFKNLEDRYKNTVKKLLLDNLRGAVFYLFDMFKPFYAADEDADSEYEKNSQVMSEQTETLLRILATKGFEEFTAEVCRITSFLQLKYEVNRVSFIDGEWKKGKSTWKEGKWIGEDTSNTVFSQSVWENVFS